jgi:predicted ATPase
MLKRLLVKNFTVFAEADFEFGPGLNVVVGTNGTGKSHVLKLGYVVEVARQEVKNKDFSKHPPELQSAVNKWTTSLFEELPSVFQTVDLKNLVAVNAGEDDKSTVEAEFDGTLTQNESVRFEIGASGLGTLQTTAGREIIGGKIQSFAPVFLPAKEILTLSWMLPVASQLIVPAEGNYLHLLTQLRGLPRRQPAAQEAIIALTNILGGEVKEEGDKYYLVQATGKRREMSMVAEGLRKFGTLQKLLINGSLTQQTTLYWDEPEANLNPALLKKLATVLATLARQGFQIILATHSLFLMKELHILSRQPAATALPIRYFGLNAQPGEATHVTTVNDFEDLPDIVALDVALEQGEEFLNTLNEPNANV